MAHVVPSAPRKRNDPRRMVTHIALIEAAERLFADVGVDAVSTRQIAAAIGSLNTNVVAYHFGGKDGLIEAIFRHRLPIIDERRRVLLAQVDAAGAGGGIAELLRAFALPLFEQVDAGGQHSFVRFMLGLERSGMLASRATVSTDFPQTNRLIERMLELLPHLDRTDGLVRIRLITAMISSALQLIDYAPALPAAAARRRFDDVVQMAASALGAPRPKRTLL